MSSSSVEERFRKAWEAKFPFEVLPQNLEFLRRPKNLKVLEKSLDRCVLRTDELNSEISRLKFISEFILLLMDKAGDEDDDGNDVDEGDGVDPTPEVPARCYRDPEVSSFEMIELDEAQRTYSFDSQIPKRPGPVRTILDRVKGSGVGHASSEPNIPGILEDRPHGKPPKAAPKNPNRTGAVGALASLSSQHLAAVFDKSLESGPKEEDSSKNREAEECRKGSGVEKENINERRHSSGNILDNIVSVSPQPASKGSRARSCRSDLYEEALPFARSRGSEPSGEKILSDEEHDEESNPIYYNILLFNQQTLDRAKMVYFNDEPCNNLERQARKLSMRCNQFNRRAGCRSENLGDGAIDPVAQRHNRQSMITALAGFTEGHSDVDEIDALVAPLCAEEEKLQMRRALVTSILDSEQDYVDVLDSLLQTFKLLDDAVPSIIPRADIVSIFLKIPDLHRIHLSFICGLRPKVEKWSNEVEVAEIFHHLAEEEYRIAPVYLKNYQKAISTVKRCCLENQQFGTLAKGIRIKGTDNAGNLDELLHKPVVRIQRNTLVLQDLINCTPPGHTDYDALQKTHSLAQKFLNDFENPNRKNAIDSQRYLVKNDIVVEQVANTRKLRHIFLFNDIFVCARQKVANKRFVFELEWYIALVNLEICNSGAELEENKKADTEPLRRKVVNLQNDLKVEMKRAKASCELERNWSCRTHTKNVEKIRKKLLEQKCLLILESPNLPFVLFDKKYNRKHYLLLSSDYERTSWMSAVQGVLSKDVRSPVNLSVQELNSLLNAIKLPRMSSFGSLLLQDSFCLEEEFLFGSLTITIRNLEGLQQPLNTYCRIEVDSFGHFLMQAKTQVIANSSEPDWNEDFDIDLEGAQTLRILCYCVENGQSQLIGKNAYELSNGYLTRDGHEEKILINEMSSLSVFLIYRSREQTLKRTLSSAREGLFGVRIRAVTRREGSRIPLIVTACVEDIESRGMQDVGIYRVSGLASEVQRLKKAFEKNSRAATSLLKSADINVVTGLLKLYFRELPEALFTDAMYPELVKGMSFSDPEAKEKYMSNVFRKLPEPNYTTATFIMDHLIKVSAFKDVNKMTLQNLATVFGPTLLRPAVKEEDKKSPGELFVAGAREALTQVAILQHLLSLRSKSTLSNPS